VQEEKTSVSIGGVKVYLRGMPTGAEGEARRKLKKKEVSIDIDLRLGKGKATVLTCDLTEGYIKENAEYTS
jgi:glutamate N-acetyltransferase/amino-acid N-acetyltransferase